MYAGPVRGTCALSKHRGGALMVPKAADAFGARDYILL